MIKPPPTGKINHVNSEAKNPAAETLFLFGVWDLERVDTMNGRKVGAVLPTTFGDSNISVTSKNGKHFMRPLSDMKHKLKRSHALTIHYIYLFVTYIHAS